jgi:LmbE family N-acetylglucosaminyl deacetylase
MLHFNPSGLRTILCLGAHSDDIEIGCGGTLLALQQQQPALKIVWVVFSAQPPRDREAYESAGKFLVNGCRHEIRVKSFRTSFFPYEGEAIKEEFEEIKQECSPDLILTHYRDDRHQDHRLISDLTWNTFRSHLILEYEIPKYDGDVGCPNMFVQLTDDIAVQKVAQLMHHFQTQTNKHWFTPDLFQAMMRIRGMECGARYAEAFYARKLALGADIRPTPDTVMSAARETASRPLSHALPVFT